MRQIADDIIGWPFLISTGRSLGVRVVVVPHFLVASGETRALFAAVRGEQRLTDGLPQTQTIRTDRGATLTCVYRRVPAASDAIVRLRDGERTISTLTGHVARVTHCAFSRNGAQLATSSWDHTARVWAVRTGAALHTVTGHTGWVSGCGFSPTGRWLITASWDGTVRLTDPTTETAHEIPVEAPLSGGFALAFAPDRRWLAAAGADNAVYVVDLVERKQHLRLTGHRDQVTDCAFSTDGRSLVTVSQDGSVRLWDLGAGDVRVLAEGQGWLTACAFSPGNLRLAVAGWRGDLRVWEDGSDMRAIPVPFGAPLRSLTFRLGGGSVLGAGRGGLVEIDLTEPGRSTRIVQAPGWINGCATSGDGRLLAWTSVDDGTELAHSLRDSYGRRLQLTEGYVVEGKMVDVPVTEDDWDRAHTTALAGLSRLIAKESTGGGEPLASFGTVLGSTARARMT